MAWRRGIGQDPALNPKTSGFRVQRVRVSGLGHKSCTSRTLKSWTVNRKKRLSLMLLFFFSWQGEGEGG